MNQNQPKIPLQFEDHMGSCGNHELQVLELVEPQLQLQQYEVLLQHLENMD